jgi:hypothetical protein
MSLKLFNRLFAAAAFALLPSFAWGAACSLITVSAGPPKILACTDTSATTITLPIDWNTTANTVEGIGGGQDYNVHNGGSGGTYAKIVNYSAGAGSSVTITVGGHDPSPGNTTFGAVLVAPGGGGGGATGSTIHAGGTGGSGITNAGGGGGGAGGPNGNGVNGNNYSGTIPGSGGAGDNGSGGSGGTKPSGAGGNGNEWGSGYGSGGGGGGGSLSSANGGGGGGYGGGGGAFTGGGSASGYNGILILTYTPPVISFIFSPAVIP